MKLNKEQLKAIIREEYDEVREAAEKSYPKIEKKLEEMRKKLKKEMAIREASGQPAPAGSRKEKRVQLSMVSEILDIPVNELMLYFLNCVKASNDRHLVEYRLGHVYFYDDE